MCGITVQLIFAFLGTRVPYHIAEAAATPHSPVRSPFANASAGGPATSFNATAQSSLRVHSATSSPNLGPSAPKAGVTAQQLLTRLTNVLQPHQAVSEAPSSPPSQPSAVEDGGLDAAGASSASPPAAAHRAPLVELFDFASMTPLVSDAVLHDDDVLLVLCDLPSSVELVEALQLEWLEVYSGAHRPHQPTRTLSSPFTTSSATDMAVCTTEERLHNVAHARLALCRPVPLHLSLLSKEFGECATTLSGHEQRLEQLKSTAGIRSAADASTAEESAVFVSTPSAVAERFPLLVELEPVLVTSALTSETDGPHAAGVEASFALCDTNLSAQQKLLPRVAKQLAKIEQLVLREQQKEGDFAAGESMRELQAYLDSAEQSRDAAQRIIHGFQEEMTRQLKSVRFLVAHITHLRNIVKKARRDMGALDLILTRLSVALQRPQLLEQAESLLRRRVVLRRAARRQLLLLQETEYNDLQRDLDDFSHLSEVQRALPAKVRWYLRAPLPSLQPAEDAVATLLDHALIDRDVDAAQELVERTRVVPPVSGIADPAQMAQHITDTLLPVERLVHRAEAAEAAAEAYKARIEELELKVREYETIKDGSSKSLDTTETAAFPTARPEEQSPS